MDAITSDQDIISLDDINARMAELESMTADDIAAQRDDGLAEEDLYAELAGLRELRGALPEGATGYVRDSYFGEYAQVQADDIGDCRMGGSVEPYVDWAAYADAIQQDWTEADFGGVTYWGR